MGLQGGDTRVVMGKVLQIFERMYTASEHDSHRFSYNQ